MKENLIIELKDCWTDSIEIKSIKNYEVNYNPLGKYFIIHVLHFEVEHRRLLETDITIMKRNFKYCYVTVTKERKIF